MWSGRERKAYPPTYGCQLGSPRSQLLLRGSATWVSPCLFYLLSISMPAAHRPSRDALFSRSLTVYHFPISSPIAWCGFFISFLSAWLSWRVSQATAGSAWTLLMPFLSFSAGPLVWTYHLLHASSQLQTHMYKMHLNTKWVNAGILYTKHNTHCFSSIFLLFERSKVGRLFDFIDFTCRCTYYSFTLASHLQTSD